MAFSRTGPAFSHWLLGAEAPATYTCPDLAAAATAKRIPFGKVNSYLHTDDNSFGTESVSGRYKVGF